MEIPSPPLLGSSPALHALRTEIEQVAQTAATVLILGETGSGKEVVARQIHSQSRRAQTPLIAVNCGSLTPSLAASELFGHEAGAFTGALRRRNGFGAGFHFCPAECYSYLQRFLHVCG